MARCRVLIILGLPAWAGGFAGVTRADPPQAVTPAECVGVIETMEVMIARDQAMGARIPGNKDEELGPDTDGNGGQMGQGSGACPTALAVGGGPSPSFPGVHYGLNPGESPRRPADTMGAIGPNHFVETLNGAFAAYDRATGYQLVNINLDAFFPSTNTNQFFDPRVLFDQYSRRWFVAAENTSGVHVAVSLSDDAMGSWFKIFCSFPDPNKVDYTRLGIDFYGVYIPYYYLEPNAVPPVFKDSLMVIPKAQLVADPPQIDRLSISILDQRNAPYNLMPAHTYGPPVGQYFVSLGEGIPHQYQLWIRRVEWPYNTEQAVLLSDVGYVQVPAFSFSPNAPSRGTNTNNTPISLFGAGYLQNAVYRDGSLWTCHTIDIGGRSAIRWYEIDPHTDPPSLKQYGNICDPVFHYYYSSIAVNRNGHVLVGFSGSHADAYVGSFYATRLKHDPEGEMTKPLSLHEGVAPITYGKWGDYSATTLDPEGELKIWTIQEHAYALNVWGDWIGAFTLDCNENGIVDSTDVASGTSVDCNVNGIPDACEETVLHSCQSATLTAPNASTGDNFGNAVSLDGNTAIVGAYRDDAPLVDQGSARMFRFQNDNWLDEGGVTGLDSGAGDLFGLSVAVSGDVAVVGACHHIHAGKMSGSAYVFRYNGTAWLQEQELIAMDAADFDKFGYSVSVDGNLIAVGAPYADLPPSLTTAGAVYVFRYNAGTWTQEYKLVDLSVSGEQYGTAVSVFGSRVAVGAPYFSGGRVVVHRFTGGTWVTEARLKPSDSSVGNFGISVAMDGPLLVAGLPQDACENPNVGTNCGSAYVFWYNGSRWVEFSKLRPSSESSQAFFGDSVATNGQLVIVGAPKDSCPLGTPCADAWVYRFGTEWRQEIYVPFGGGFGPTVTIGNDKILLGRRLAGCNPGTTCGAVDVFSFGTDGNCNNVLDVCDPSPTVAPPPHNMHKNRYVSFTPNSGSTPVAFEIKKLTAPTATSWVGAPDANGIAQVVSSPVYRVWPETVVHVGDCEIVPAAMYEISATTDGTTFSSAYVVSTIAQPAPKFWGDTTGGLVGGAWDAPNGVVNANDFQMVLQKFLGAATAPHLTMANVQAVSSTDPCLNDVANIADVFMILKAFMGETYPFTSDPACCPAWCPDGAIPIGCPGCCPGNGPEGFGPESGVIAFDLNVAPYQAQAGQTATVEVYVTGSANLGAFETALTLTTTTGTVGTLTLESLTIDSARTDYTFNGQSTISGVNLADGKAGAALGSGSGTDIIGPDYLSTYTYRASNDASGVWEVRVSDYAYLLDGDGVNLAAGLGDTKLIRVGVECTLDVHCDDVDACTTDTCTDGVCVHAPVVCNDGNLCTTDACVAGVCQYTPITCNDGNTCTSDACVAGVCVYTNLPNGTLCNDGLFCTKIDKCNAVGVCVGGTKTPCTAPQVCCEDEDACLPPGEPCLPQ